MTAQEFERKLMEVARENLREDIDADAYVDFVLNQMWDGEKYVDQDGYTYHEIGSRYTRHKNPIVIS